MNALESLRTCWNSPVQQKDEGATFDQIKVLDHISHKKRHTAPDFQRVSCKVIIEELSQLLLTIKKVSKNTFAVVNPHENRSDLIVLDALIKDGTAK